MEKVKLRIDWLDGYQRIFDIKNGSLVKFEQNYIYLMETDGQEYYIPVINVRYFGYING